MAFPDNTNDNWRRRAADRLICWFSTHSGYELDRELAAGADPNHHAVISARARLLISERMRTGLASTLERYLTEAWKHPRERRAPVPVRWDALQEAAPQLSRLARRLRGAGRISPQGVARARILLTDGTGPLYGWPGEAGLWTAARAALLAFDWGPELAGPAVAAGLDGGRASLQ